MTPHPTNQTHCERADVAKIVAELRELVQQYKAVMPGTVSESIVCTRLAKGFAAHAESLLDAAGRVEKYEKALEKIVRNEPCSSTDGVLFRHYADADGNLVGEEPIDPVGLCGYLIGTARAALTERSGT